MSGAASAELICKIYGQASAARICRALGSTGEDPQSELTHHFRDRGARERLVADLPEGARELLAFTDQIGRRLRGERLKKRWFLHGYAEFEERMEPLIDRGIVLIGNASPREAVTLETLLEQGVLQHWVQITPGFEGLAGDPPEARTVVEEVADETTVVSSRSTIVMELNILNAVRFVEQHGIRLNRDGSPHRSDLRTLAPMIVDPPSLGRPDMVPDPNQVEGWDALIFTLSMAEALGLVERRDDMLRACSGTSAWFRKSLRERMPLLVRALEQQRAWSEIDALQWYTSGQPPLTGQGDGGFCQEETGGHGAPLAGPRGSVIAALRRLNPLDWTPLDETIRTIAQLERAYLTQALPGGAVVENLVEGFVKTALVRSLVQAGAVELGRGREGQERFRLTAAGRAMIGVGEVPEEPGGQASLLVEPNFEITCFVDRASLRILFDLTRFAEIVKTSQRVVRYRLAGEPVQWGYARGYTSESILALLGEYASQPVPSAVSYALADWERLHRRVTVFLYGDIVAASGRSDPEVVQSGVRFAIDGEDNVELVDGVHTFVVARQDDALERALRALNPRVIDYDGPIIPGLTWLDGSTLRAPTGETDLRILARLQRIGEALDDDTWKISPERVRKSFGEFEGLDRVVGLLREAVIGGLTAERELAIKRLLGAPATARVEPMEVLILGSEDDGDRVARIPTLQTHLAERLGPRAFRVVPGCLAPLIENLERLGVDFVRPR